MCGKGAGLRGEALTSFSPSALWVSGCYCLDKGSETELLDREQLAQSYLLSSNRACIQN